MSRFFAILLTALPPMLWGSTYIITTEFLPANHPFLAALLRILPAGLILLCVKPIVPKGLEWFKVAVLGILNLGLFQSMLFVAAYRLPGGLAAVLGAIQPIIVMILMTTIGKVLLPKTAWIAATCGVIGMSLMLYSPTMQMDIIGIIAALIGALSMALGTFLSRYWKVNLPIIAFTGWQLFFGGLFLIPIFLSLESWPTMTMTNIAGYAYLSLFGALLAYLLWFRGIKLLSPAIVSSLGLLSPVTAFILGWIFLNQVPSKLAMIGFATVLVAIFIIQRVMRKV